MPQQCPPNEGPAPFRRCATEHDSTTTGTYTSTGTALTSAPATPRYNPRRPYRSVVYRTWKALAASAPNSARPSYPSITSIPPTPATHRIEPDSRMCASSDNFWERGMDVPASTSTLYSPPRTSGDCFSSQDYLRFTRAPQLRRGLSAEDDLSGGESELDESVQSVEASFAELRHYATMNRPHKSKHRGPSKGQLFHKRSQSAGANAVHSLASPPTSPPPPPKSRPPPEPKSPKFLPKSPSELLGSPNPLGFFRRIYRSVNNSQHSHSLGFSRRKSKDAIVVKSNGHSHNGHSDEARNERTQNNNERHNHIEESRTLPRPPPKEKPIHRTLSHGAEGSLRVQGPLRTLPAPDQFNSWDDAYQHLKSELWSMRVGDRAILRQFQVLEAELRGVKGPEVLPSPILELPPNLEDHLQTPTTECQPAFEML